MWALPAASNEAEPRVAARNTIDAYCRRVPRCATGIGPIDDSQNRRHAAACRSRYRDHAGNREEPAGRIHPGHQHGGDRAGESRTRTKGFLRRVAIAAPENTAANKPIDAMASGTCSCVSVAPMDLIAISGALPVMPANTASRR